MKTDTTKLYNQLCTARQELNTEEASPPHLRPTFVVIELALNEEASHNHCNTYIIDPDMPESGDTKSYLALPPMQRMALEVSELIALSATNIAGVCIQGPVDEHIHNLCQNRPDAAAKLIRYLALKGADLALKARLNELVPDSESVDNTESTHSALGSMKMRIEV